MSVYTSIPVNTSDNEEQRRVGSPCSIDGHQAPLMDMINTQFWEKQGPISKGLQKVIVNKGWDVNPTNKSYTIHNMYKLQTTTILKTNNQRNNKPTNKTSAKPDRNMTLA